MLIICHGRGWISSYDQGANVKYYLYNNKKWFWTISSYRFDQESKAFVVHVGNEGYIGDTNSDRNDSGVQIHELCY